MRKHVVLLLSIALLASSQVYAETYHGSNLTVTTDLDARYAELIISNVSAFTAAVRQHFSFGPDSRTLQIYYSRTQADTQKLLDKNGYNVKAEYGYFAPEVPAVYAHQFMDDGQPCGWGELFKQVSHSIVRSSFQNCPAWFDEGLSSFLGEERIIVKTDLSSAVPSPRRGQILRDKMEQGTRPSVRRLLAVSATERFSNWDIGPHFAQTFFCWLYDTGCLDKYLTNVKSQGYELSVLEKTVGKSGEKINLELLKYIKKNCFAGAYLKDGLDAKDCPQKQDAFLKALELKPNYSAALHELAKISYKEKDYGKCREHLAKILNAAPGADYRDAEELMGDTYYNDEKNCVAALQHYQKAWEYSNFYEYKYRTAYKIANCYYKLNDHENTRTWYATFLNCNWEPESMKAQVAYAQTYTGETKMAKTNGSGNTPAQTPSMAKADDPVKAKSSGPSKVKLETSMGDIIINLDVNSAPITTKNFLRYVEEGFFDGTIFHRVIPNFMIQGGGFTPDMQQKKTHEPIKNEASNGLKNDRGTLAMARTNDPDSATAQFFINVKNNDFLNYGGPGKPGYAVFGKVVEGMEVVDKIVAAQTTSKGMFADVPVTPIVIKSAKVVTAK